MLKYSWRKKEFDKLGGVMTLTQLRYAITVANSDSMNEAARNLFISQPSLSAAIKELEEEAGIEIFRRTNRGISVTLNSLLTLLHKPERGKKGIIP